MISGRIIVCVASSWDYDPTSKHHVMSVLSRCNDVVWVNYHGTRRPSLTRADLRTGCSVVGRFLKGVRRATPSIIQVTPLVIPGVTKPFLRAMHKRMLVAQVKRAVRSIQVSRRKPLQVWSFAPDVPYLVGEFGEECFLYYCVDEHSQFKGFNAAAVTAAENELIDRADIVVTTSQTLLQRKQTRRPDAVLVRHGVDYDRFAQAWRSPPARPHDLAPISGPILGFFGLIDFWVDVSLIAQVAKLRPGYSFVLIGDCKSDVSRLRRLPNVHLLGRRSNEYLPAYCTAFSAGLLPFVRTAMTRNVNPIKMYEYLAAGLPIVSTPLPEAARYLGPIAIAETPEKFAQACDLAIATLTLDKRKAISRTVAGESWESRVDLISQIITDRLWPRVRDTSIPVNRVFPSTALTAPRTGLPFQDDENRRRAPARSLRAMMSSVE